MGSVMSRELLKRAATILHDHFDGVAWVEPLLDEIEAELAKPDEPVVFENKKLKEQREMLLSLVKNYLKYEIFELQDQGFSKEEILDLSILEPYFKAIKAVEGEDYYF